jgi:general secretion pathway protein H
MVQQAVTVKTKILRSGMNSSRGFTLLEALIVTMILSLAGTIGGLAVSQARTRAALAAAEAQVVTILADAQSQARRSGSGRRVVFDLDLYRLRIEGSPDWQHLPRDVELTVTAARELGAQRHPTVIYLGDGTSSGANITLTSGGYARHLRIDWLTGGIGNAEP